MDDQAHLLRLREDGKRYQVASSPIIRAAVPQYLWDDLDAWLRKRRLMDPAVFISLALCDLERLEFDAQRFERAVLAGAAAAIADDLIDVQSGVPYEETELFRNSHQRHTRGVLGVFAAVNRGLIVSVGPGFCRRFAAIINAYNQAQMDSAQLSTPSTSPTDILDIKTRAGGFSVLLLYALMFPQWDDAVSDVALVEEPGSQSEALYGFGAWLSRVDDLWDVDKDRAQGIRQLATEGLVTWNTLPGETATMVNRLRSYFRNTSVDTWLENHYAPLLNEELFRRHGAGE